jgi:hypothetical protein
VRESVETVGGFVRLKREGLGGRRIAQGEDHLLKIVSISTFHRSLPILQIGFNLK